MRHKMQFNKLNITPKILKALEEEKYEIPTPIQEEAIPLILGRRDLLGCAQTGTGKTAAFAIPTLQLLNAERTSKDTKTNIRALIITPTRELALQIYNSFKTYGKYTDLKYCVIFGGVSQKPQEKKLMKGVDILVATPGRLNDLVNQKLIDLKHIEIFILDEADRMLDMGFIHDVKKIISIVPDKKQTLLFSATMPHDIEKLADTILKNPAKVAITPNAPTVEVIEQFLYYVDKINKKDLLIHVLNDKTIESALVFSRTKHGADRIVRQLTKANITAQAIHGDKAQNARQTALRNFKEKKIRVLIATDIAARGIDIDELTHVINYDLPTSPETYVHRIGRTGRAGLNGVAISFCDFDEKQHLADIEKLIRKHLIEIKDHPFPLVNNFPAVKNTQPRKITSQKPILQKKTSAKTDSQQKVLESVTTPKKKYRMTADGKLKEKKSFSMKRKEGKRDISYFKRDKVK